MAFSSSTVPNASNIRESFADLFPLNKEEVPEKLILVKGKKKNENVKFQQGEF